MKYHSLPLLLAISCLASLAPQSQAQLLNPLEKLWAGEAQFEEQPEAIGNYGDHMHFLSMFWDSDPIDTPGSPHYKAYYIGGPGFSTRLARSFDGINFTDAGTVVQTGQAGEWDSRIASFSSVWKDNGIYYLVYEGAGETSMWRGDIGLATSTDGVTFTKQGRILEHSSGTFESTNIGTPSLYKEDDTWYMYYHGYDGQDVHIGLATGTNLATDLTRVQTTPIISTSSRGWDSGTVGKRSQVIKEGDYYYMAYEGSTDQPFDTASWSTGIARSTDLVNWDRLTLNPVIPATGTGFGNDGPEMVYVDDDLYLYYRIAGNQTARAKLVSTGVKNLSPTALHEVIDETFNNMGDQVVDLSTATVASVGEVDRSDLNKISRIIAKFDLSDIPVESIEKATLRFAAVRIMGTPAGPLSVWHSQSDNEMTPLASGFEDPSYVDTAKDILQPNDLVDSYFEIDVTSQVLADYAADGFNPVSAFRLQINEALFFEDDVAHQYRLSMPNGTFRPMLQIKYVPEPTSSSLFVPALIFSLCRSRWLAKQSMQP